MIVPIILLLSLLGMMLNLSLAGLIIQPDWSAALLLASILHSGETGHGQFRASGYMI